MIERIHIKDRKNYTTARNSPSGYCSNSLAPIQPLGMGWSSGQVVKWSGAWIALWPEVGSWSDPVGNQSKQDTLTKNYNKVFLF